MFTAFESQAVSDPLGELAICQGLQGLGNKKPMHWLDELLEKSAIGSQAELSRALNVSTASIASARRRPAMPDTAKWDRFVQQHGLNPDYFRGKSESPYLSVEEIARQRAHLDAAAEEGATSTLKPRGELMARPDYQGEPHFLLVPEVQAGGPGAAGLVTVGPGMALNALTVYKPEKNVSLYTFDARNWPDLVCVRHEHKLYAFERGKAAVQATPGKLYVIQVADVLLPARLELVARDRLALLWRVPDSTLEVPNSEEDITILGQALAIQETFL